MAYISSLLYRFLHTFLSLSSDFELEVVSNSSDSQFQSKATGLQWWSIAIIHTKGVHLQSTSQTLNSLLKAALPHFSLSQNYFYVTFIYIMSTRISSELLYYFVFFMSSLVFYMLIFSLGYINMVYLI